MPMDDDADDDLAGNVPPLPPDDRLWRHPSELSTWGPGATTGPLSVPGTSFGRTPAWPIALVAGLVGAAVCGGVMAVTGTLSTAPRQRVIEKVAMTPVVSSPMMPGESGVEALTEKIGPAVARLVVTTEAGTGQASGVVVRDDGLLYTSAHEVAGATAIVVLLADGRRYDGELVGADLPTDVAVVSIDTDRLTVAVIGSSSDLRVGTPTMAVGSSGDPTADAWVTTGVVSATDRRLDVDGTSLHGMIQTDAPIEAAWAGGPLVDATGAVIGITTGLSGGADGFGFATPIDVVRRMADELLATGKVVHGWLGIEGADVTSAQAATMGIPRGAAVRRVREGSPAARGGLEPDDVITEVGDHRVMSSSGLVVAMRWHKPGEEVVVGFWRDGSHHEATVMIDERP